MWAQQNSDAAVMELLDLYGPLAVGIDASAAAFQSYKSGIYASTVGACSSTANGIIYWFKMLEIR